MGAKGTTNIIQAIIKHALKVSYNDTKYLPTRIK